MIFPETFPLLFRQTSPGYCSVYLLANIFRDESLMSFIHNSSYCGCDDKEVNTMLERHGLAITTILYAHQSLPPLSKLLVYESIKYHDIGSPEHHEPSFILMTVYLLTVQLFETVNMFHHVAVLKVEGNLYYIDPYQHSAVLINRFQDFESRFYSVCQVQMPYTLSGNTFAYLFGNGLGYSEILYPAN